jgi:hypothetical protein
MTIQMVKEISFQEAGRGGGIGPPLVSPLIIIRKTL